MTTLATLLGPLVQLVQLVQIALLGAPADELPKRLADTGLYADFAAGTLAADVMTFSPQYPLWTDGAAKCRYLRLPPGTTIDATRPDAWDFPVGTKLWKDFSFGRRVETRFIERRADGWTFASYVWSEDGSDAVLAPERGVRGAARTVNGTRDDVPSRYDCVACHQAGASPVLGASALQLSSDRDPLALHAEPARPGDVDLAELVRRGLVRSLPQALVDAPPRIAARTPRERAALGYLHANCGHCHNRSEKSGPLRQLGLDLAHPPTHAPAAAPAPAPALATTLDVKSQCKAACGEGAVRVAAGDPDRSVLARRLATRDPLLQMPPLGTRVVDEQARELITAWIREELAPAAPAAPPASIPPSIPPHKE